MVKGFKRNGKFIPTKQQKIDLQMKKIEFMGKESDDIPMLSEQKRNALVKARRKLENYKKLK